VYNYSTLRILAWVTDGAGTSPTFDKYGQDILRTHATKGRTNNIRRKEGIVVNKYRRKEKAFKRRDHLDDLSVYGRIILKRILKK